MPISLINPDNYDNIIGNVIRFGFYVPTGYTTKIIFKLDIDTVDTFDSGNLMSYEQRYTQGLWKYLEDSTWITMEDTLIGRGGAEARCILNKYRESEFPSLETTYYWRIGASDDIGEDVTYNNFTWGQVVYGGEGEHRGLYNNVTWGQYIYD